MKKGKEKEGLPKQPTKSELEILQVLWQYGPSPVRFVNGEINAHVRTVEYASTLKLMQLMVEKGLLFRDETQVKHVYRAAPGERKTKGMLLNRFVDTFFNGSASSLMMQLLNNRKTSPEELEEIRELLRQPKNKNA